MNIDEVAAAFEDATGCSFMDADEVKAGNITIDAAIRLNVKWLRDHIDGQLMVFEHRVKALKTQ